MLIGRGEITLIAGTTDVRVPRMPPNAIVHLAPRTRSGTVGKLAYSITPTGFTVTSDAALDSSAVAWAVFG